MRETLSVGTMISGFRTLKIEKYPFRDAHFITFEHVKSGAHLLYIACDDTDRAFNIAFRTVAHDDKGLPHIFEHSTLAGSEKYPSSNLVFEMMNRTYTTYMNAATYQCATMYPSSSLSEDQLMTNLDVYMSGVTAPLLLSNEFCLKREAFRYVLNNPDDEIVPTGAVYNEMKGNYAKISYSALKKTLAALFPDSVQSYVTGGIPDDVLRVTWQDVKEFHAAYYHPSNMLITLYGKLDFNRFLSFLDSDYLSRYDRKEIMIQDNGYHPFNGQREYEFPHPVSADNNPEKGSVLCYAIALNGVSFYERALLSILCTAFNLDSSVMKKNLSERLPGGVFDCSLAELPIPAFMFSLTNVNPEDKPVFEDCLRMAFRDLAENGLDQDIISMAVNSIRMKTILDAEDSGGVSLICDVANDWACSGNITEYLEECKALQDVEKCAADGTFDRLIRQHLVNPSQCVLTLTRPVPGGAEDAERALKAKLSDMKSQMSPDAILSLIDQNRDYEKWAKECEKVSLIDRVKSVRVEDLPEEASSAAVEHIVENGIRYIYSPVPDAQYLDFTFMLDASSVPVGLLHDYAFFSFLLGALSTETRTFQEVEKQLAIYAYDYSFKWENYKLKEGGSIPCLSMNVLALSEHADKALELAGNILLHTEFSDYSRIRSLAAREMNEQKNTAKRNPHLLIFSMARAMENPSAAYDGYLSFTEYWDYLSRVSKMTDEEMEQLAARFRLIRDALAVRSGLSVSVIGSRHSFEKVSSFASSLADSFSSAAPSLPAGTERLPSYPRSLAIGLEGGVQFNGHYLLSSHFERPYSAKMRVLFTLVRSNYLLPELRFRHGAYGVFCSASEREYYVFSYRDPELKNTYDTFANIGNWLASQTFSQSDLEGPITSCYSDLAKQLSPLDLAKDAIMRTMRHAYDPLYILKSMRELKQFRPEDVAELSSVFDSLCGEGVTITAGPLSAIEKNKDRFESVLTDLIC
ncbi:MAG: insulinase family protein [Clostridia bacterium]|nr:insulinase family protein [Clostridia bacterium]